MKNKNDLGKIIKIYGGINMTKIEIIDLLTNKALEEMHWFFIVQNLNDRVYFYFDNDELKFVKSEGEVFSKVNDKILKQFGLSFLEYAEWKECFLETLKEKMAIITKNSLAKDYNIIKNILFRKSTFDNSNCKYKNDKEVTDYYCKNCNNCNKDSMEEILKKITEL